MIIIPSAIFFAALCFIIRVIPRKAMRYYGRDAFYHLFVADIIRKTGNRNKSADYFLIGEVNDYPPVLHYFLSIFPERFADRFNMVFSPAFDAVNTLVVYLFAYAVTGQAVVASASALVYILIPQLQQDSLSLTPRILGPLFFNLFFASLALYVYYQQTWTLAAAVVLGTIDFFTHRIQLPLLLILSVVFAILARDPLIAGALACSLLLAYIINRNQFVRTLKCYKIMTLDAMRHWKDYGTEATRMDAYSRENNSSGPAAEADKPAIDSSKTLSALKEKAGNYLAYNPYGLVAAAFLFYYGEAADALGAAAPLILSWFIVTYVTFMLTEHFGALGHKGGEGFREFLTLGAFPCAVLVGIEGLACYNGNKGLFGVFCVLCVVYAYPCLRTVSTNFRRKLSKATGAISGDLQEILSVLRDQPRGNVMGLPPEYSYVILYFARQPVLEVVERSTPYRDKVKYYASGLRVPLAEIVSMFNINYILVNTGLSGHLVPEGWGEVIAEEGRFLIVKAPEGKTGEN